MDPNEVADKVMDGIRENRLYIFTHPEWRTEVESIFKEYWTPIQKNRNGSYHVR